MSDLSAFKVGDTVWWVPRHGLPRERTVTKVGRLYLTLDGREEVVRATGRDRNNNWGAAHPNREAYDAAVADDRAWGEFVQAVYRLRRPAHLDAARIREIAALLGITVP